MKISLLILALGITGFASAQNHKQFKKVCKKNSIAFEDPIGFTEVPTKDNGDLYYNYALKLAGDSLEVRYTIHNLKPFVKDYKKSLKDPNETMIDPNKICKSMFLANILNVSQIGIEKAPKTDFFDLEAVKKEFNADLGGTSAFPCNSEFSGDYKFCMMIMLHKDNEADVYITYLSNDFKVITGNMMKIFHALKFKN